jgi:hypothetical protein
MVRALVLALVVVAQAPEEDALTQSEPEHLDQSGLATQKLDPVVPEQHTPPKGVASPATAAGEAERQGLGSDDPALGTDLPEPRMLPPVEPGTPGKLWQDPAAALKAAETPPSGAAQWANTAHPQANQPSSRVESSPLDPVVDLLRPSMPEELLSASRIMLAVSAGLGATLAVLGAAATVGGNVLYAMVNASSAPARQRGNLAVGGTLLLVGAGIFFTGALACLMVAVTAATVGKAAEMATPPPKPAPAPAP